MKCPLTSCTLRKEDVQTTWVPRTTDTDVASPHNCSDKDLDSWMSKKRHVRASAVNSFNK